jgi:uncharacterized protein (UPF0276 family)
MIQLGANGSEYLEALIEAGQVQVDYLKVGPFLGRERIAHLGARYPLLLHGGELTLSARPPLDGTKLAAVHDYVALTGTPWFSIHLGFAVEEMTPGDGVDPVSGTSPLSAEEARRRIIRNARILRDALPVPLLLENVPRFPNTAHNHVCEPDFITAVVQVADTAFLLDLAHARVSASCLGYDLHEYLCRLPLDRTVEIHVSGPRWGREFRPVLAAIRPDMVAQLVDDVLYDVHEPLRQEDYDLVTWALRETPVRAITLEYWRDKDALREQLLRLRAMVDARP